MDPIVPPYKELKQAQKAALHALIKEAGYPSYLAKMLGVPVSTVHNWCRRGRISRAGARLVEECAQLPFTAKQLRPDL